jgi:Methyltransferase domain
METRARSANDKAMRRAGWKISTLKRIVHDEGLLSAAKAVLQYSVVTLTREAKRVAFRPALRPLAACVARVRLPLGVNALSERWGWDRGFPIHRYYLEQFLRESSAEIQGHCLEFQNDVYTTRFGGPAVTKLDLLHVDDSNRRATIVADLTKPNHIASNSFDCIICTHVLHLVFEVDKAISDMYRILKPGGILLVAVPHVSMYDPREHEFWRFTPEGLSRVLAKVFGAENVSVTAYGNSLAAAGEIRGLASQEFTRSELNSHDQRFAVEVCARAVKKTGAVRPPSNSAELGLTE